MAPTTHFLESTLAVPQTVRDIQRKLDTAAVDGDTIVLKGRFPYASTEVLRLYKSVTLQGDPTEGATIVGGKQIEWGQAPDGTSVPIAATLDNITFDAFTTCAIRISGAGRVKHRDNLIRNCRFTNYRYGIVMKGVLEGAWPIIAEGAGPLGGSVTNLTGTLTISGCHFGAPDATSIPLDANGNNNGMNNLIHVNNCDLQHLVIKENVFDDVYWMGIAVWGVTGLTEILDNTITKKSSWLARPGSGNGIAFGLRPRGYPMTRDGSVTIARNTVDIASPDSYGIVVGLYATTWCT